jgi:hypothetical protein
LAGAVTASVYVSASQAALGANFVDQEAHALIVGGIQPEHAIEDAASLLEASEAPQG